MKNDCAMKCSEMLHLLRHGDGFCGWAADQHAVNHFGEHVWFERIQGGYTECCDYDNECAHHKKLRDIERSKP